MSTPLIQTLQVIPVAGRDSMLLNLSGAHGPFFTRNIVVLTDSDGHTGVGEVPGGENIRRTVEDARDLLVGRPVGDYRRILQQASDTFADRDAGGRAPGVGVVERVHPAARVSLLHPLRVAGVEG